MRWMLPAIALTACGRLRFDPSSTSADASLDTPVASDLLVQLTFDAGTFLDDTGGGAVATCTSCPTPVAGISGGGASFDGVSNCLSVPVPGVMPPKYTYAIWERADEIRRASIYGRPKNGATTTDNSFEIFTIDNVSMSLFMIASNATLEFESPVGAWHHVAGVFDGSTFTVYLDGTERNAASMLEPQGWTNDPIRIGCDINTGVEENYFYGAVDDARLYSRALSAAEIAQLAIP